MPTRFLFWNVQNFTYNKINFEAAERVEVPIGGGGSHWVLGTTVSKSNYILNNIACVNPDIFVLIEVVSGWGTKGNLVSGIGAQGVLALAERLRKLNAEWCVVPPLKLTDRIQVEQLDEGEDDKGYIQLVKDGAYTEAIAVFFRRDRVDFIGPNVWPSWPPNTSGKKTSVPPGKGITPGAYPDEWQRHLPANNYYAGQFEFKNKAGNAIEFPAIGSRRPFVTKFQEKYGARRILTVAAVHFPPDVLGAVAAIVRLVAYYNEVYKIEPNEVVVIGGDYNINYLQDKLRINDYLKSNKFFPFLGKAPTMYRKIAGATPDDYQSRLGLDNVAAKYGSKGIIENAEYLILDRVKHIDKLGGIRSAMFTSYEKILEQPDPWRQNELFRRPYNYGCLGPNPGTSDHQAVYVEL